VGSVRVPVLMNVESYATVHQLVTTVCGDLSPDTTALHCLRSAFPPGSMTGAPKLRSTQILHELEQGPRGIYSGCLGFLSLNGSADFAVVIRTIVCIPQGTSVGTGGAIVDQSDPEAEYEETTWKARAPLHAIACAAAMFASRPTSDSKARVS